MTSRHGRERGILPSRMIIDMYMHECPYSIEEIKGKGRMADLAMWRAGLVYVLWHYTTLSVVAISRKVDRHHTTVIHARDRMQGYVDVNDGYVALWVMIMGDRIAAFTNKTAEELIPSVSQYSTLEPV